MNEFPPEILVNVPESLAWHVFHERHPALIARLRDTHPYDSQQLRALDTLVDEEPENSTSFLVAESNFYRRLLEAIGYFIPGPWHGLDPFRGIKCDDLMSDETRNSLGLLEELASQEADDALTRRMLSRSLWGNRGDIAFQMGVAAAGKQMDAQAGLVADDSDALIGILGEARKVVFVADNAGSELLHDLVLMEHLLRTYRIETISLHVKPTPYYVSDATTSDVVECLQSLAVSSQEGKQIAASLRDKVRSGHMSIRTHAFYVAPASFHDMPGDLAEEYAKADLVLTKGDLNYRRLVGDRHWPATTAFSELTRYFPASVAALRVLKSDVLCGVDSSTLDSLNSTGTAWRTNGTYGLIQVKINLL